LAIPPKPRIGPARRGPKRNAGLVMLDSLRT
jgi:hypothetical protein